MYETESRDERRRSNALLTIAGVVVVVVVVGLILGLMFGMKAYSRYQARQDATNRVKISAIEIQNQQQRVQIAKQQAEIRLQDAIGVRSAQDEIAKTLTPLYVQFEMVDALKAIANSGRNNSVVFLPAGANGVPLVYDAANAAKVGVAQTDAGK